MPTERDRLEALVRQQTTVADKIRALAAAGVPRADIARFLGKRYQHIRNVLEDDAQTRGGAQTSVGMVEDPPSSGGYVLGKADLSGLREEARDFEREAKDDAAYIERRSPTAFWIEVKPDGTLPLPPEIVDVLAGKPGERIFAKIADGRVTLKSGDAAWQDAKAIVARYIRPGRLVSESLIADRRAEAERDESGD